MFRKVNKIIYITSLSVMFVIYVLFMSFVNAEQTYWINTSSTANIYSADTSSTNTVKQIELSDYYGISTLLMNLHLDIASESSDEDEVFYVVDLLKQMSHYSDLDIIEYLSYSFDIEKSLSSILIEISDILDRSSSVRIELKNKLENLEQEKMDCDDSKEVSDKNFTLALKDLDSKNMEINLEKSLFYEECSTSARINYKVQTKIMKLLDFYYEILEKKYSYFYGNRWDIISHYKEILYDRSQR